MSKHDLCGKKCRACDINQKIWFEVFFLFSRSDEFSHMCVLFVLLVYMYIYVSVCVYMGSHGTTLPWSAPWLTWIDIYIYIYIFFFFCHLELHEGSTGLVLNSCPLQWKKLWVLTTRLPEYSLVTWLEFLVTSAFVYHLMLPHTYTHTHTHTHIYIWMTYTWHLHPYTYIYTDLYPFIRLPRWC